MGKITKKRNISSSKKRVTKTNKKQSKRLVKGGSNKARRSKKKKNNNKKLTRRNKNGGNRGKGKKSKKKITIMRGGEPTDNFKFNKLYNDYKITKGIMEIINDYKNDNRQFDALKIFLIIEMAKIFITHGFTKIFNKIIESETTRTKIKESLTFQHQYTKSLKDELKTKSDFFTYLNKEDIFNGLFKKFEDFYERFNNNDGNKKLYEKFSEQFILMIMLPYLELIYKKTSNSGFINSDHINTEEENKLNKFFNALKTYVVLKNETDFPINYTEKEENEKIDAQIKKIRQIYLIVVSGQEVARYYEALS
jgi:hypothetical protein